MINALLLSCLVATTGLASDNAPAWSKPINGLRARIVLLPPAKQDSRFQRVYLELENVAEVAGQMNIRFNPDQLKLRVTSADGKDLAPPSSVKYSGLSPLWKPIMLPYAGSMKFLISFPGLASRPSDTTIIDVGFSNIWIIPDDGKKYFLSGTLSIKKQAGDYRQKDWSGVLELPEAEITRK